MNSFIENVNYVAGLDNLYGSGIELYKNNLSLKSVQHDIELKFSYYNNDDKKIHSIVYSEPGVLVGGINDPLLSFKTLVESSITGSEFTCTVSSSVQDFVINNIVMVNINITSNSDTYKTYELEMKVVTAGAVTYDVFGEVKDSLKILPSLAMITASDINVIANVYEIQEEIVTVSESIANVTTVSDNIANVNTVGISISNVNIVSEDIANVNTVSTHISNVDTVSESITNVNTVGSNIVDVGIASTNIASINTVANAQNLADIIRVADDLNSLDVNGIADITIVANDLVLGVNSNIITVSESIDNVNITGNNIDNVNTVGINITDIGTVSNNIANVNITATDISSVNNVSLNIADVNTVSDGITNVNIVSGSIANVNTVATNIVGLNSIVSNITEILLADDNAAIATTKALESSDSAESSLQSALDSAASAALFPNHIADTTNPHEVTKSQVGLEFSENTADIDKVVASAGKLTSPVNISLSGDVSGSVSFDGSNNVNIATTIGANSVILGTDTTGNYVAGFTQGTGISITGSVGEGWSPTVSLADVGTAGTYRSVTADAKGRITAGTNPTTLSGYGITDVYTKTESNTSLALKVNNSERGAANGVSTLDVNGKVVLTQIPDSVLGQLEYMGVHNFTTMPTATQKGQYWIASVSGNGYIVGDWAVWNGTAFDKVDNTDAVATVAGRTGNVVLTKSDVGLSNADNTADSVKNVLSATKLTTGITIGGVLFDGTANINLPGVNAAGNQSTTGNAETATKWQTARTITLNGDLTGSVSIDGSANVILSAAVAANSVALGTDTTGNYVAGNTAGTGIVVTGTAGEGWSPTIALSNVGIAGTYRSVTTDAQGRVTAGTNPTTVGGYGITDTYTKTEVQTVLPKVGFDTTNVVVPGIGQVAWNQDENTLDLGLNGAVLQVGQEHLIRVRNNTVSTITNGSAVMATGTIGNSGRITIANANLTQANAKYIFGIVTENIISGADGFVTAFGKVRGIQTNGGQFGETWVDGDVIYVKDSGNGALTKIAPTDTQVKLPIAIVVHAHGSNGTLFVRVNSIDENHAKAELALKADKSYTYTKGQVDTALALKVDDSEIASVNLLRADKYLAAQNVVKMTYDINKKLIKVQYNNPTDIDYEVLSYTDGKLTNVAHYVGSVLKGNTVLTYVGGLLDDAPFIAV